MAIQLQAAAGDTGLAEIEWALENSKSGELTLRIAGRYVICGLVNPGATFMLDGNDILRRWINIKGVHNYHPRHLIQALDFVVNNRERFPFAEMVNSKFSLDQLNEAFACTIDHRVLRAAIVP